MARKKAAPKKAQVVCPACGHAAAPASGPLNFCPDCGAALRGEPAFDPSGSGAFLGRVIGDRYRLLALLGEGGMGAVYRAEHVRMGKALAVKVLRGAFALEPGAAERFTAEARIVSRLSHPHTIAVFDFGEIDDASGFYLAMEYVPGKDLAAVLREVGRLPERRVVEIGRQVLGSLAEAHDAGIVHRDVKPGNVMLTRTRQGDDFVKVLDFGIAKLRGEASQAGGAAIVGTPSALAPEQARGGAVDGRADLYAVGCLLHELAAGRPPFTAPSPMAVVAAHLHQPPPPLSEHAPGTSRRLAEVVLRALAKRPEDRFATADEMREALRRVAEGSGGAPRRAAGAPQATGALQLASRDDFRDFERQVRALRRSRVLAPLLAALALLAAGAAVWRWPDLYALLAARAPAIAARVPVPLRPAARTDGDEQEPNDLPSRANRLALPPGPDGREGGGVAAVRGHVGAKLSPRTGDVDVFRVEVPPGDGRRVLVATWRGEREGEGIRGLDVALALNRAPEGDGLRPAPLVSSANRGGAGQPERLVAAVEAGVHYLAVREHHHPATGPVEKPTDAYVLEVRLAAPEPGVELEPNDAPERDAPAGRYPAWRALAERNPLAAGERVRGEISAADVDLYAVARGPALLAAVPAAGLGLAARRWVPDADDLGPPGGRERVRLEPAGEAEAGAVLLVPLPPAPAAPALVELRAAAGEGGYEVVALGEGSGDAVLGLVRALAGAGRLAPALELAAGYAEAVPGAVARDDVLLAAGRLAEEAARTLAPDGVGAHDRAARLLGASIFEVEGGQVRYRGAFEAAARGAGRAAEEAALRRVALAAPCTADEVLARAAAFLARTPAPPAALAAEARVLRARALEELFWASGGADPARREAALAAWTALGAAGEAPAGEAALRAAALSARDPSREGARPACP